MLCCCYNQGWIDQLFAVQFWSKHTAICLAQSSQFQGTHLLCSSAGLEVPSVSTLGRDRCLQSSRLRRAPHTTLGMSVCMHISALYRYRPFTLKIDATGYRVPHFYDTLILILCLHSKEKWLNRHFNVVKWWLILSMQTRNHVCLVFRIHYSKLMDKEKREVTSLLFRIRDNLECLLSHHL